MNRLTFTRSDGDIENEERIVALDGQFVGITYKAWHRLGGWGWTHKIGSVWSWKTMRDAARPLVRAYRGGKA